MRIVVPLGCLLALLFIYSAAGPSRSRIVLWVWERPENLSKADPATTAIAVLVKSIDLRSSGVSTRPRLQPLKAPPRIESIAVVRIASEPGFVPSSGRTARVADEIVHALPAAVRALQIDYDARESERGFYRDLLTRVRREVPKGTRLSITALASWCLDDPWIRDLPIDDAVPMLFRMGADRRNVVRRLAAGGDFSLGVCRQGLGLSLDEPIDRLPPGRRIYLFSPSLWDQRALSAAANLRITP